MILQYKDYKNNWHMEEARQISWNKVDVGERINDFNKKNRGKDFTKNKKENILNSYINEMRQSVDQLIKDKTGIGNNIDIIYHIDCPFDQMEIVSIVLLRNNDFDVAYVFDKTAYILNSEGKTVQRV